MTLELLPFDPMSELTLEPMLGELRLQVTLVIVGLMVVVFELMLGVVLEALCAVILGVFGEMLEVVFAVFEAMPPLQEIEMSGEQLTYGVLEVMLTMFPAVCELG